MGAANVVRFVIPSTARLAANAVSGRRSAGRGICIL